MNNTVTYVYYITEKNPSPTKGSIHLQNSQDYIDFESRGEPSCSMCVGL